MILNNDIWNSLQPEAYILPQIHNFLVYPVVYKSKANFDYRDWICEVLCDVRFFKFRWTKNIKYEAESFAKFRIFWKTIVWAINLFYTPLKRYIFNKAREKSYNQIVGSGVSLPGFFTSDFWI